jgi:Uma2 family endonuclease
MVTNSLITDSLRWTTRDLEVMPDDGGWKQYEIVDGELFVTRAPHFRHQNVGGNLHFELEAWSRQTQLGASVEAPGVIFSPIDAVIPDVVWISRERLANGLDEAGHLIVVPELMVEVLSPGEQNEQRDKEVKLKLYSRYGVQEYWIVNWQIQTVEIYRHDSIELKLIATLSIDDTLTSPLLPSFSLAISQIF